MFVLLLLLYDKIKNILALFEYNRRETFSIIFYKCQLKIICRVEISEN